MSADKLISFIIPAHNAEQTIEETITSILSACHKRLADIEIISVENGSADKTLSVLSSLQERFPELRILQSDKGVSNARNYGLKNSRGRWVAFVDADDQFLPAQMAEVFSLLDSSDKDMLMFDFFKGDRQVDCSLAAGTQLEQIQSMVAKPTIYMTIWNKIFKRKFLLSHQIYFDSKLRLSEDGHFMLSVLSHSPNFSYIPLVYYSYRLIANSTMSSLDDKASDYTQAMQLTSSDFQKFSFWQPALDKYILCHLLILLVRDTFHVHNPLPFRAKYRRLRQLVEEPVFRESLTRISLLSCLTPYYIVIAFLKCRLYLLAGLLCRWKSVINNQKIESD